jgi:putative ABC transport system permease protein
VSDLRVAVRGIWRQPSQAAVAIITLAIGISGASAIFTVLNSVVLRPLPYPHADRLVLIRDASPPRFPEFSVAPGRFLEWQARTRVFDAIGASTNEIANLTGRGDPRRLRAAVVSASFFAVGGVNPLKGRTITADDDRPGAPRVAVISYALWRGLFDGRDDALGQTLMLNEQPVTVVGIMPAAFALPNSDTQLWLPLALTERQRGSYGNHYLACFGRLKPGVTIEAARQDLARAAREIELLTVDGTANKGWTAILFPLQEYAVRNVSRGLFVLSGAVGVVLLIACANVANLLLARGIGRQRELAVRAALGATRGRLVRQMLVENLLVALVAAIVGLGGALAILKWVATSPTLNLPRTSGLDHTTLMIATALAVLTPLVFGVLPALHTVRTDLTAALGTRSGGGVVRGRTRAVLIVGEVALAMVLVQGAGLLIRSFDRLTRVSPGFVPERAVIVGVSLPEARYSEPARRTAFWTALSQRVAALHGVEAVGLTQSFPMVSDHVSGFDIAGKTPTDSSQLPSTNFYAVTPGFFRAMGIPIVRGRDFQESDGTGGPRVCVISKTFADRWFADDDPLGKRVHTFQGPANDGSTIIGVVGDIKQYGLDRDTTLQLYEPRAQHAYFNAATLIVRTAIDPADITAALRSVLKELDPALPIADARQLSTLVDNSVAPRRLTTVLLAWFAGVALLLASIGVFGLVSFMVAQRTQEIGIRVALGAAPARVLAFVFRQGLGLTVAGIALGTLAGFWTTKLLQTELFEVTPHDGTALVIAPAALLAGAALACYWPARRALRVDPAVALRQV